MRGLNLGPRGSRPGRGEAHRRAFWGACAVRAAGRPGRMACPGVALRRAGPLREGPAGCGLRTRGACPRPQQTGGGGHSRPGAGQPQLGASCSAPAGEARGGDRRCARRGALRRGCRGTTAGTPLRRPLRSPAKRPLGRRSGAPALGCRPGHRHCASRQADRPRTVRPPAGGGARGKPARCSHPAPPPPPARASPTFPWGAGAPVPRAVPPAVAPAAGRLPGRVPGQPARRGSMAGPLVEAGGEHGEDRAPLPDLGLHGSSSSPRQNLTPTRAATSAGRSTTSASWACLWRTWQWS